MNNWHLTKSYYISIGIPFQPVFFPHNSQLHTIKLQIMNQQSQSRLVWCTSKVFGFGLGFQVRRCSFTFWVFHGFAGLGFGFNVLRFWGVRILDDYAQVLYLTSSGMKTMTHYSLCLEGASRKMLLFGHSFSHPVDAQSKLLSLRSKPLQLLNHMGFAPILAMQRLVPTMDMGTFWWL